MLGRQNLLSHSIFLLLFVGHLMEVLQIVLCLRIYLQAALAFSERSSVAGLDIHRVHII
jgi:hypothetical protein